MEGLGFLVVGVIVLALIWFLVPRLFPHPEMVCTRCEGTGAVDEKWPDPSQPGGWHVLKGTCPKCKGKGKVKAG